MIKQIKILLILTFGLFAVLTFVNPNTTYAASSSSVGVVNYQLLINQHPDMAQANETYKLAVKQAQDDFNAKSTNMNDDEKRAYSQQLEQGLRQKKLELLIAIQDKINAAVKTVANAKGLTIVVDKSSVIYGGQDITDDVLKKITAK